MTVDSFNIDGKTYLILKEAKIDNNTYYYLANKDKEDDFLIRKLDPNNQQLIMPLDNEEELNKVLLYMVNSIIK